MTIKNTMRNYALFVALITGNTYEEAATLFGISPQRVQNIFKTVRKDLLEYMQTPEGYNPTLAVMRQDKGSWLRCANQYYGIGD